MCTVCKNGRCAQTYSLEELDSQKKQRYKEAIRKLKEAHDVFKRLNKQYADLKVKKRNILIYKIYNEGS